ncbi:MAG: hypothetical protein WDA17_02370 [Sphaerochaetaceae bacterium]
MGKIRIKRGFKLFLFLILPLFFVNCGIPFFLSFDDEITISNIKPTDNKIEFKLNISNLAEGMIDGTDADYSFTDKPALKFFYVISANPDQHNPIANNEENTLYILSNIETAFKNNIRGLRGNGTMLYAKDNNSFPAFFLYTKSDGSKNNFSRTRNLLNQKDEDSGILVGTFSKELGSEFIFDSTEKMDYVIGKTDKTFELKLDDNLIKLSINGVEKSSFGSYIKQHFSDSLYLDRDEHFYNSVIEDTSGNLYIHIWVSVYGGTGSFTNIYWSELKYLGKLTLKERNI